MYYSYYNFDYKADFCMSQDIVLAFQSWLSLIYGCNQYYY